MKIKNQRLAGEAKNCRLIELKGRSCAVGVLVEFGGLAGMCEGSFKVEILKFMHDVNRAEAERGSAGFG